MKLFTHAFVIFVRGQEAQRVPTREAMKWLLEAYEKTGDVDDAIELAEGSIRDLYKTCT